LVFVLNFHSLHVYELSSITAEFSCYFKTLAQKFGKVVGVWHWILHTARTDTGQWGMVSSTMQITVNVPWTCQSVLVLLNGVFRYYNGLLYCCYSFLDLWSNTVIGTSCNSVSDVCNHFLNGLCIVKESRLVLWNNTVFILMDLMSCGDSSTKCNFCNHIVIGFGVQKRADSTEGPLHLEPLKTLVMVFNRGPIASWTPQNIGYGVQKRADSTEGPLHLETLKTKRNRTLLLVFVGDVQSTGIVITPPTFTCFTNAIITAWGTSSKIW
jgi:hypothetical protein